MEQTTKERILDEALVMFAEHGCKGTKLRDLAALLDLSKSALYKHYESGEDIWNALLDKMEKGLLKTSDPAMLAFSFTPPISALIHLCDREPDRHDEAFERMQRFFSHNLTHYLTH